MTLPPVQLMAWLRDNSAAIQAVSSFITLLLTSVVVTATVWYARLTSRSIAVTEAQLAATFVPIFDVNVNICQVETIDVKVINLGPEHLDVVVIELYLQETHGSARIGYTDTATIVRGGGEHNTVHRFPIASDINREKLTVKVECSDVSRFAGKHTYEYNVGMGKIRRGEVLSDWKTYTHWDRLKKTLRIPTSQPKSKLRRTI